MDKNLSLLGLSKKAGLLYIGEESVGAAARTGKAKLIISAADASERSRRQAAGYSENYGVFHIITDYSKEDFGLALGRGGTGMMALGDTGLASRFVSLLEGARPGRYGEAASGLRRKAEKEAQRRAEKKAHKRNVMTGRRRTK